MILNEAEIVFDTCCIKVEMGRLQRPLAFPNNFHKVNMDSFVERYKNQLATLRPFPEIICDYTTEPYLNAFAWKEAGKYVIGINNGAAWLLFDLYSRMMAKPDVFSNIGNPRLEIDDEVVIHDYYTHLKNLVHKGHPEKKYRIPRAKCKIRRAYAFHLTMLTLRFIFEHELSHILFGHVDWAFSGLGLTNLDEIQMVKNEADLDILTLEFDADSTSLARSSWNAVLEYKYRDKIDPLHAQFCNDQYESLTNLWISVFNFMKLFGYGDYTNLSIDNKTHPGTTVRLAILYNTFPAVFEINSNWGVEIDQKKLYNLFNQAFNESEKAYERITGKPAVKEAWNHEYGINHPLVKAVEDHWRKKIHDKLLPHTYRTLAKK